MGLMNVLRKIMTGVEIAGEVADSPEMEFVEAAFPSPWLKVGLGAVRTVNNVAETYANKGRPMDDEAKRTEFARTFRAELPEEKVSNGDLATLAGLLVKLEKGENRSEKPEIGEDTSLRSSKKGKTSQKNKK